MRKLQIALIAIVLLIATAMLVLQSDWGKELAQKFLLEALSESGYKVKIGKFEGTLPHAVLLKDLKIESDTLEISIDSLDTRLSLLALLKKELLFTRVTASGISWVEKPGTLPSFGKGEGLSFSIRVKQFLLTDVHLPENGNANFEGAVRLGKRNKDFYFDVSGERPEFPESKAHLTGYLDENGLIRLRGSLKSPTLKALPLPLPFDASADLQFTLRGKKNLSGQITGTLTPHSVPIMPVAPWLEKNWKINARIAHGQGWEVSRFLASTDLFQVKGSAKFDQKGHFDAASLVLSSNDSQISAKLGMTAADQGGIAIQGTGHAAKLNLDSILLEQVQAHGELVWRDDALSGSGGASGSIDGKILEGKTDFSWENEHSLFLTHAMLQSSSGTASGDLEIRPDKILIGQMNLEIENLHDLPFGVYGKLQGKADWLMSNGKQVLTTDLTAFGFYWKELFAEKVSIDASLIDPFGTPQGRILLDGEEIKWHQMFLEKIRFETLLGAMGSPFTLATAGKWKHPLELNLGGVWEDKTSHFSSTLQTVSGSFYNHPIALAKSVEVEFSKNLFRLNGLDLSFSNARLYLFIEEMKENLTTELVLEKFPLDILSLNPLDVSIAGQTDLTLSVHEEKGKVDGTLNAKIFQLEIAAAGETPPLRASGAFEGRFDNERLTLKGGLGPLLTLDLSLPIRIEKMPFHASLLYDQRVEGHLALKGRIEEILDFVDLGTHRIEGNIASDLTLTNTLQKPEVAGTVHFEKGAYENYLTGTRLLDIRADGKARGDQFILESFVASDGRGTLTLTGKIDLLAQESFPFRFDLAFTQFNVAQIDLVSAEAEGKIQITGNLLGAVATGNLEVVQSDFHVPDRIPRSLPNLTVVYRNPVKPIEQPEFAKKTPYPFHLDLEVKAPEAIHISGRGLDSEWKGNFHIGGTYTSVAAIGKLELIKGEFVFAGRRFKLVDGALSFTGKEHEMPHLNLAAQMEVKDVLITARLKGPLNNPQLTLQSDPPLPMSTILAYLLFGQEVAEINSFQALQLANSLASIAGQGPDVLESTRKALGVDRLSIVSVSSGEPEIEDTIALQVGKYISEGVLVSLTQGAEDSSTNINIEIELKSGWVVQLESDQRQEQGKFTIKWNHNY